jgi:tyrocidine synthetase-3
MEWAQRFSKLSPEQKKLFELKLKQKGIDISQIPALATSRFHVVRKIEPAEEKEYYPLSASQMRMYILNLFLEYSLPLAYQVEGNLDRHRLEKVFQELIKRHESFRTSIELIAGQPVQKIHKYEDVEFKIEYYQADADTREELIKNFFRPFDLARPSLMRARLIKLSENAYIFLVNIHHLTADGFSWGILNRELIRLYKGETPPVLKIRYRDFSQWQNQWLTGEEYKKQEHYWLNQFPGDPPVLDLQTDYPRPSMQNFTGRSLCFDIAGNTFQALKALAALENASFFIVLLTILNTLLFRYTSHQDQDVVIGTIIAGREHQALQNIIGLFINTLTLRNTPAKDKTITRFLKEVKLNTLKAYDNQLYPFGDLMEKLVKKKDRSRNPLFDVMVIYQNRDITNLEAEGLRFIRHPEHETLEHAQQDITLWVWEEENRIVVDLEYCTALFKPGTMEQFAKHLVTLLKQAAANPKQELSQLEMLSEKEKRQILEQFNDTKTVFTAHKMVHQLFEEKVERTPDHIAVIGAHELHELHEERTRGLATLSIPAFITYRQLNEHSKLLARLLQEKGAQPDSIVGIMTERSIEMIIAVQGILKAGGAYLPIEPDYPGKRIKYMLKDSKVRLLVTTPQLRLKVKDEFKGGFIEIIDISNPSSFAALTSTPTCQVNPANLAYIIYTSGSTGKPKGVMVEHRNLSTYLNAFENEFEILPTDTVLQQASYSFDAFAEEVYPILLKGGKIAVPNKDEVKDMALLTDFILRYVVTVIDCSPLLLKQLNQLKLESTIRIFISGGDILKGEYVDNLVKKGTVYNTFGPTEATICASYYKCPHDIQQAVPIGKPIANYCIHIMDQNQQLLPVGIPGELCISGQGVSRGYMNQPGLTAEKFDHDLWDLWDYQDKKINYMSLEGTRGLAPLSKKEGTRGSHAAMQSPRHRSNHYPIYKTGDLARWLADGNIEYLGRIDQQVKIRGYRIELQEIEHQLMTHDDIKEAVVIAKQDENKNKYLCAYLVPTGKKKSWNISALKKYLTGELPGYMIPTHFIKIDAIPLTPNGKIDVKALYKYDAEGNIETGTPYVPPTNEVEKILVGIFEENLIKKPIGIHDDFFDLGGDSISANRVIARLREEYQVELSIRKFFESPTIDALSGEIEKEKEIKVAQHIGQAPRSSIIPLSFSQERLWFLHQLDENIISYHVPRIVRLRGKLDVSLMERTFNEIIRRHEILRTVFPTVDGQPIQKILEPFEIKIPVINLTGISPDAQPTRIEELTLAEGQKRFDFQKGPLMRLTLLKLKEKEHLLMSTEHHFIHDGWTQGVLLKEFIAIYSAFYQGKPSPLPELPIQYADFTIWQKNHMQGEILDMHLAYWQKKLAGLPPVLELPMDRPRPHVSSGKGGIRHLYLSEQLSDSLKAFSKKKGVTLFITMLTVFKVLLYRYTGREDLCVGTGIANRRYKEIETLIGMIINTLPLRTRLEANLTFNQCLKLVKTTCIEAYEYEDTPFEKIVEALQPERTLSYNPLFQVLFSFMDTPTEYFSLPGLEVNAEPTHNRSAKFDLNIVVLPPPEELIEEIGSRIYIEWEYNTDIFDQPTMERMIHHYLRLLELVPHHQEKPIYSIPMLSETEIHQLLSEWNNTAAPYPYNKTIHELFEKQAAQIPDNIALLGTLNINYRTHMTDMTYITYKQLNQKANQLAYLLQEKDVRPDNIIGIMVEPSIEMVIGILGILKAGGVYLPIEPDLPGERIQYMLADSSAKLLLAAPGTQVKVEAEVEVEERFIDIINISNLLSSSNLTSTSTCRASSANLAYIIYTSGSTGKPKGVMVQHGSAVNVLSALFNMYPLLENDAYLLKTSLVFDVSVTELFGWFWGGGRLVIVGTDERKDPWKIIDSIENSKVTHINFVPSLFHAFAEALASQTTRKLSTLKYIFLAGEVLLPELVKKFRQFNTHISLENLYGPTEGTVYASGYSLSQWQGSRNIPIGKPLQNTALYILDRNLGPVPIGITGELCIAGHGVARGYLNNPELTAEKFILAHRKVIKEPVNSPMSYQLSTMSYIYQTGDLARWLPDGNIEFLGRQDHQVKIRGFRIELGEIENQLLKHGEIKETVVLYKTDKRGDKYLCAYIVSNKQGLEVELKNYLSHFMPDYMIPSYFVFLENIPLSPHGKIDRKALPNPMIKPEGSYISPRNSIEEKLATLWVEILGIKKEIIGINHNFFRLGGHSLNAVSLIAGIHREFNVKLSLARLFKSPYIKSISESIQRTVKEEFSAIPPVEKKEYYALSSAQKRLYFLQQLDLNSTVYNIPFILSLDKNIEKDKLESTLKRLISRHEGLRTSFMTVAEEPRQLVRNHVEFEVEYYDLSTGDTKAKEGTSTIKDFIRPFDLSAAPLIRSGLIKHSDSHRVWIVDIHHIVSDGTSNMILARDFISMYNGKELPSLPLHYKDFSLWQNRLFASDAIKSQEDYWLALYSGEIPRLNLPTDYKRPEIFTFAGDRYTFHLEREETKKFKALGSRIGATLYMNLLTALNTLFYKYTGQTDVIIGTGIAGRPHLDTRHIIGMFVNILAMRNYPHGKKNYEEFLKEVIAQSVNALENQELQFEELVDKLDLVRNTSRNPLFDISLVVQNFGETEEDENLSMVKKKKNLSSTEKEPEIINKTAKFDMTFYIFEEGEDTRVTIEYYTGIFKKETIQRLALHFKNLIKTVIQTPYLRLKDINILSEQEMHQVLYTFNDTAAEYPKNRVIHELFADRVERIPDSIAVVGTHQLHQLHEKVTRGLAPLYITYKELNQHANQLAYLLQEKDIRPDNIIGIMVEASIDMVIGIFGILKAGGAYLPIEPDLPGKRIQYMLADSSAKFLLAAPGTQVKVKTEVEERFIEIIDISNYISFSTLTSTSTSQVSPANLAYIIYTSGTTGGPKGVTIEHRSLVNLCSWHNRYYRVTPRDHAAQYARISFDASVWETFPYLITGASLYIINPGIKLDIEKLNRYYETHDITIGFLPTQFCEEFMKLENHKLRILLTGGDYLQTFIKKSYAFYNNYGPTENTVVTTSFPVQAPQPSIPIGQPIDNNRIYILDKNIMHLQPIGIPGELCIAGDGLARGYLNKPGLTAEKFDQDLWDYRDDHDEEKKDTIKKYNKKFLRGSRGKFFQKAPPGRRRQKIYKTDDSARWLPDGNIEFLGRQDHQVKIRGFRIETAEIEQQLLTHPRVHAAVVTARENQTNDKYLCAYLVSDMDPKELKEYLSQSLPGYMIPSYFIAMEKIPLNLNGKVDRKALPEPQLKKEDNLTAPGNPVEKTLAKIWAKMLKIPIDVIGIDSDFFELGGHSLRATVLVYEIHKAFDVKLPLTEVFRLKTPREIGKYINNAEKIKYAEIQPIEKKEYYELSSAQQRLFLMEHIEKIGTTYNIPVLVNLQGSLDTEMFNQAFKACIQRHESLRTSFAYINETPVQRVHDEIEFQVRYHDLSQDGPGGLVPANIPAAFVRPFDLTQPPLLRTVIFRLNPEEHLLFFDIHHIIADGTSIEILIEDIARIYTGEKPGSLKIHYKDFSSWQNNLIKTDKFKKQLDYWLDLFPGEIPVLELPTDYDRPPEKNFAGGHYTCYLEPPDTRQLTALNEEMEATLYMNLLTILNILLFKYTGQEDIIVGSSIMGRPHAELEKTIGMFINFLPMRNCPNRNKTYWEFSREVKERALNVFENQDIQFEELVRQLNLERDPSRNPLFDVTFAVQNFERSTLRVPDLTIAPHEMEYKTSKFDLTLLAFENKTANQLVFHFEYAAQLFQGETIEKIANHFREIIQQVIQNKNIPLNEIKLSKELMEADVNDINDLEEVFEF